MSLDLEAIRARLAAATPGPWRDELGTDNDRVQASPSGGFFYLDYFIRCGTHSQVVADATFIASAPTDIGVLVAEVERLRAENNGCWEDATTILRQRSLALEAAASYLQPGPDGQDYIDRARMIEQWLDEGHEALADGDKPYIDYFPAYRREAARALEAERDELRAALHEAVEFLNTEDSYDPSELIDRARALLVTSPPEVT